MADGDDWVINGAKTRIANAPLAKLFVGVGMTVASAMITIFFIFAGRDRDAEED